MIALQDLLDTRGAAIWSCINQDCRRTIGVVKPDGLLVIRQSVRVGHDKQYRYMGIAGEVLQTCICGTVNRYEYRGPVTSQGMMR